MISRVPTWRRGAGLEIRGYEFWVPGSTGAPALCVDPSHTSVRSRITHALFAPSVSLGVASEVGDVYADVLRADLARYRALFSFVSPPRLPLDKPLTLGSVSLRIPQDTADALPPGDYLDISIGTRATLRLGEGRYSFRNLCLKNAARLIADGRVDLRLMGRLEALRRTSIAPAEDRTARDLRIQVSGACLSTDCSACGPDAPGESRGGAFPLGACDDATTTDPVEVSIGNCSTVRSLLSSETGKVMLGRGATVTGAIAADTVEVGAHTFVNYEDGFGCHPASCSSLGCGVHADGCGSIVNCGACETPQGACYGVTLFASETHDPDTAQDGSAVVGDGFQFALPDHVSLTDGRLYSGGVVTLSLLDTLSGVRDTCAFRASEGTRFDLQSCESGAVAGDLISANLLGLHLQDGASLPAPDGGWPPTTVALTLTAQPCNCLQASCASLSAGCGVLTDGCGGLLSCGMCEAPESCGGDITRPQRCGCTPRSCTPGDCGTMEDGCGGIVTCAECASPETCGGAGTANRCGCTANTCKEVVLSTCDPLHEALEACREELLLKDTSGCAPIAGALAACLANPQPQCDALTAELALCEQNAPPLYPPDHCEPASSALERCVTESQVVADRLDCGFLPDGCGGFSSCGNVCAFPETCGAAGEPNVCGCVPATCDGFERSCGTLTDGCGQLLNCGGCPAPSSCDLFSGRCSQTEVYTAVDDCARGASIEVDSSDPASGQTFSPACDSIIAPSGDADSTLGPIVTVGPAVRFDAGGLTTYPFDSCANICVPYSPTLLASNWPATAADLQLYLVTTARDGGTLLVPMLPQTIDAANHRICTCSSHLSTYVVALREYCFPSLTSTISVTNAAEGPVQEPANTGWTLNAPSVTYLPVEFVPPVVTVRLDDPAPAGPVTACLGVLLFYGRGALEHVCHYDTAIHRDVECYYPFNSEPEGCTDLAQSNVTANLIDCYKLHSTSGPPPPELGAFAIFAGKEGNRHYWVDPRRSTKDQLPNADTYNMSLWFIGKVGAIPNIPSVTASATVRSHPQTCETTAVYDGNLSACGDMGDGCGGTLRCSRPRPGTPCPCDSPFCCGGSVGCLLTDNNVCGCPDDVPDCAPETFPLCEHGLCCGGTAGCTQNALTNVCGCPDDRPDCAPGLVTYCGDVHDREHLINTSNPCQVGSCDPTTGLPIYSYLDDETPYALCARGGNIDKCSGVGRCISHHCVAGPAPLVDDGNPCTDDRCDSSTGKITHPPVDTCAGGCPLPAPGTPELSRDISATVAETINARVTELKNALRDSCPDCAEVLKQ